jgi:hypothetical protein
MPREGMGSGTEGVVDCHGHGWAVTRDREGSGTEGVVVCHDPGWVVAKGKEGPGTASCSWSHEAGRLVARAPRAWKPAALQRRRTRGSFVGALFAPRILERARLNIRQSVLREPQYVTEPSMGSFLEALSNPFLDLGGERADVLVR